VARYLVAGGGGFIGSNLVEALLLDGHDVRALDNFATGRRENLERADAWARDGGTFELIEGDIRVTADCRRAVDGVDYVLHQAALPSVPRSIEDPTGSNAVNVTGTLNLLEAGRAAGVRRFVFASSSSIYGESESLPKVETMPSNPISPYGLQKLAGETYCRLYHRLYGMPTVALRYFNVFGPRQDPHSEYAAVVPRFLTAARDGGSPTIFGDGEQTRDFTFVANVVHANRLACEAGDDALGRAFNIACGDRISLNDLVAMIGRLVKRPIESRHEAPRAGDIKHSMAGIDLARRHLGFEPQVGIEEGLRRTLDAL